MIYRFELKRQFAGALGWAAAVAGALWFFLYGFYPVFLESRPAMESYLATFPPELVKAFGFDLDDLFGFPSFSGLVYLYESLLGAVMISTASIAVFAREKRDKCQDFLLTRPVGRREIFFRKLLCCLTLMGIVNIPYMTLYAVSFMDYTGARALTPSMALSMLCLPLTQFVFLAFGIFAAVFLRRVRSPAGVGAGIGMFAFLLSAVYSLTEKEALRFLSPLSYFSAQAVMETGGYDPACVATAAILGFGLAAAAYVKYTKGDTPA